MSPRRAAWVGVVIGLAALTAGCRAEDDPTVLDTDELGREPSEATTTSAPATTTTSTAARPDDPGDWLLATQPLAAAAGAPRLFVSGAGGLVRVDGAATVRLDSPGDERRFGRAVGDGTGVVVAEVIETEGDDTTAVSLVRFGPDGPEPVPLDPHGSVALHDIARLDDSPTIVYALFADPAAEGSSRDETGQVLRHDLRTGATVRLATAAAPEHHVVHASVGPGAVVLSSVTDLTETISFVDHDGELLDRPSPTDDLEYNAPPFVTDAVLSLDGRELARLEGPDVDPEDGTTLIGDWQVVVDDSQGEQLRLTVADQRVVEVDLDFDGRWLLVSGRTVDGPLEPILIDTESVDVGVYRVTDVRGTARIEDAASG